MKILLVDDSATVLMMERMILAAERFEIVTAANGEEAHERARQEQPDLILMDIVMPKLNGIQACRALKQDPQTKHIPVILVSTRGEAESLEAGYSSGCNDYVTKPVNSAELLGKIRNLLGARSYDLRSGREVTGDVELQNANVATLYAAGHALHTSSSRDAALAAMQEIVTDLVGSEQFAIVSGDEQLTPQVLFGVRAQDLLGLTGESGIIGRAKSERRPLALLRGMPADVTRVRACIPLQLAEKTRGFVLIFGFLPQKDELSPLDHELFSLMGTQAAAALLVGDALSNQEHGHAL
jgi:CheY-like chemotaxis protein